MWAAFRKDESLLDDIARLWIRPIAAGYLPPRYREHLAGGRLVALSKHPKPGIRPICISDAWRRLTARGLGAACQHHFRHFFQHSKSTALQFGGNTKNGANNMYHLLASMAESSFVPATGQGPPSQERADSSGMDIPRLSQQTNRGTSCTQFGQADGDEAEGELTDDRGAEAGIQRQPTSPNSWDITRAQLSDLSDSEQQSASCNQHDEEMPQAGVERGSPDTQSDDHQQPRGSPQADPLVILALDVKNAFNSLTRQHLCQFLQKGSQFYTTLEGDGQDANTPVGWDLLWGHIQVHYGCKGILKYYHGGEVSNILSQSGVQQGDPLGSTLFALAIHPILLQIASEFQVAVAAYADNVVFTGRLSEVIRAQDRYSTLIAEVGLQLNPAESQLHVPEWRSMSASALSTIFKETPFHIFNGEVSVKMLNGDLIPWRQEGMKVLGCPLGSETYCKLVLEAIADKIEQDLALLKEFPWLHQRTKLAIYCSNTRATYFLRAIAPNIAEPVMKRLDASFDDFLAHTLSFPATHRQESPLIPYDKALQQARLGIKQGGCGLKSVAMVVPAALFAAICAFIEWLHEDSHFPITRLPWLSQHTDCYELAFLHVHQCFEMSSQMLVNRWGFEEGDEPDSPGIFRLPTASNILSWNPKKLPTQHEITAEMQGKARQILLETLSTSDKRRLEAVSLHKIPADCPDSAIGMSIQHPKKELRQCSMGLFALTSHQELSNNAFLTSSALVFGYPIPYARFLKEHVGGYGDYDLWGDLLLNNATHASRSRILSHNIVSQELAHIASGGGIPTTAKQTEIPMADDDSHSRGDLMTLVGGRIPLKPSSEFSSSSLLIMDFTLRHVFTGEHVFKADVISEAEKAKRNKYADLYQQRGFAFAPLVVTSLGVCGPDLLRFLWAVADHAARYAFDLPLDVYLSISPPASNVSSNDGAKKQMGFKILRGRLYNEYFDGNL